MFNIAKKRACFFAAALILTACNGENNKGALKKEVKPAEIILATVGGKRITFQEYQLYMQQLHPTFAQLQGTPDEKDLLRKIQYNYLVDLIDKQLMLQEASRLNIEVSPVELKQEMEKLSSDYGENYFEKTLRAEGLTPEDWQKKLAEELLIKKLTFHEVESRVAVSDDEIEEYYKKHLRDYKRPEQVRVRQIVMEDEVESQELWKKLKRRRAGFAKMAEAHSLSPEGIKGGDLGYFSRGEMPVEFEDVAFSLKKKDQISEVFQTNYGFHIFQLVDRREGKQFSLEEVKDEISEKLRLRKVEAFFNEWLVRLRARAKIKINPYFDSAKDAPAGKG